MHDFNAHCNTRIAAYRAEIQGQQPAMMHINRLYLAPAYIAVLFYFLTAVLGILDTLACSGNKLRSLMSWAVIACTLQVKQSCISYFLNADTSSVYRVSTECWSCCNGGYSQVASPANTSRSAHCIIAHH